jgi:hypothetical protein
MHRKSRLKLFGLFLGCTLAAACGAVDEGVSTQLGNDESPSSEEGEDDGEGSSGSGRDRDAGAPRMDGGDPDKPTIITIDEPDATCAATSAEAPKIVVEKEVVKETVSEEIKPVAIYLMLDRSSSMVGLCSNPNDCNAQSWNQATQAITTFARDPASANIDVALGYFPPIVSIAQADKPAMLCSGSACGTPTVSLRRANDNAASIADSLNTATPPNSIAAPLYTPTECAIRGMGTFCKAHTERTGQRCVGVLVTDGVPYGDCSVDANNLATLTAAAADAGTLIFTLGLQGANFDFLNRIATSGKTDCTPMDPMTAACDVRSGQGAFVAALNAIRDKVQVKETKVETHTETQEVPLECEWMLPEAPEGMKFDPELVNVTFSATDKAAMVLGRVGSSDADCAQHPEGWRYDKDGEPTKVLACAKACDTIKTSPGAKISIEFGCRVKTLE